MPKSPTVARWELLLRLNQWKTDQGIDVATAAKALKISTNHWHQIMSDRRALTDEHFTALIKLFGLDSDKQTPNREVLVALRADTRERGWWMEFSKLFDDETRRLFGLEHGAESIQSYEGLIVPGLLQTEDYARAIMASDIARIRPVDAELYIDARMKRQQRLVGEDPLKLAALIHEGALRQITGDESVSRGQLRHLHAMGTKHGGTIDIRIVPFTARHRPIVSGSPFHIVYFASPVLSPVAWHESVATRGIIDDAARVRELRILFERQFESALSREDSLTLIAQMADRIA